MIDVSNGVPLIWSDEAKFDEAVYGRLFNHCKPSRRPLAVVNANTVDHVKEAVKLANELGCQISVRSGGHSWAAWSVREGSILIDLGGLDILSYDEESGIVIASPAVTAERLDSFISPKGRIFNGPHCPTVGLGGFLLQGGIGWNCRGWGWAAERVVGMDVVTAEGKQVYCSRDTNSDLFWCARGCGPGFFGVVTEFHLQTEPLPAGMLASTYTWDISEYDTVMPWVIETSRIANKDMEITAVSCYPDPNQPISSQRLQLFVHLITFNLSLEQARASLDLFAKSVPRRDQTLAIHEFETTSLAKEFLHESAAFPERHRYSVDNMWIKSDLPTEKVVDAMREIFTTLPTVQSSAMYFNMAPEPAISDMALSLQTEHWLTVTCAWNQPEDDADCQDWLRGRFKNVNEVSSGLYIGDSDFQVRRAAFLATENMEKVETVRELWDPKGLFCSYLGSDKT